MSQKLNVFVSSVQKELEDERVIGLKKIAMVEEEEQWRKMGGEK
jgi:hypothetical protein